MRSTVDPEVVVFLSNSSMVHYLFSSTHYLIMAPDMSMWKDTENPLWCIMAVDTLPVPLSTLKLFDAVGHACRALDVVLLDTPKHFCCGELMSPLNTVPLYRLPFLTVGTDMTCVHKMHMHFQTGRPRSHHAPTFCNLNVWVCVCVCVYIVAFGKLRNSKLMYSDTHCACRA
jgi:hypothetical protein